MFPLHSFLSCDRQFGTAIIIFRNFEFWNWKSMIARTQKWKVISDKLIIELIRINNVFQVSTHAPASFRVSEDPNHWKAEIKCTFQLYQNQIVVITTEWHYNWQQKLLFIPISNLQLSVLPYSKIHKWSHWWDTRRDTRMTIQKKFQDLEYAIAYHYPTKNTRTQKLQNSMPRGIH